MRIVFLGFPITSSWGPDHATNHRALARELTRRGHEVLLCERDFERAESDVRAADFVAIGCHMPDGAAVATWALDTARGTTAFYDTDTPVTLDRLAVGGHEYLTPELVPRFDLYLSVTGGPTLQRLENEYGARKAVAFHCLVDPEAYHAVGGPLRWDLGYLGTYSDDRRPTVEALLLEPARRTGMRSFAVAGSQHPADIEWPDNVERLDDVPPVDQPAFYAAQRFTLNVTRAAMRKAGWSPSAQLFEAAACGVPVISDVWPGLEEFFEPEAEVLLAHDTDDVLRHLRDVGDDERRTIAARARRRVLGAHTAARRCEQLELLVVRAAA